MSDYTHHDNHSTIPPRGVRSNADTAIQEIPASDKKINRHSAWLKIQTNGHGILDLISTITVCVGEGVEAQDYTVHRGVAIKSSTFLQAALRGEWKEAQEKRVPLPDVEAADFEVYLEWLYTSHVVVLEDLEMEGYGSKLVQLYLLGDYFGDDRFSNAVIDILIRDSQKTVPWMVFTGETVDMVWAKTLSGSALRQLFVHLMLCDIAGVRESPHFQNKGDWSKEVSIEIFETMIYIREEQNNEDSSPISSKDRCAYHKHDDGNPQCSEATQRTPL